MDRETELLKRSGEKRPGGQERARDFAYNAFNENENLMFQSQVPGTDTLTFHPMLASSGDQAPRSDKRPCTVVGDLPSVLDEQAYSYYFPS